MKEGCSWRAHGLQKEGAGRYCRSSGRGSWRRFLAARSSARLLQDRRITLCQAVFQQPTPSVPPGQAGTPSICAFDRQGGSSAGARPGLALARCRGGAAPLPWGKPGDARHRTVAIESDSWELVDPRSSRCQVRRRTPVSMVHSSLQAQDPRPSRLQCGSSSSDHAWWAQEKPRSSGIPWDPRGLRLSRHTGIPLAFIRKSSGGDMTLKSSARRCMGG